MIASPLLLLISYPNPKLLFRDNYTQNLSRHARFCSMKSNIKILIENIFDIFPFRKNNSTPGAYQVLFTFVEIFLIFSWNSVMHQIAARKQRKVYLAKCQVPNPHNFRNFRLPPLAQGRIDTNSPVLCKFYQLKKFLLSNLTGFHIKNSIL